jgi:hypothetical protein
MVYQNMNYQNIDVRSTLITTTMLKLCFQVFCQYYESAVVTICKTLLADIILTSHSPLCICQLSLVHIHDTTHTHTHTISI